MLQRPFYSHNLIHEADVGGKDRDSSSPFLDTNCNRRLPRLDLGHAQSSSLFDESGLDEETANLLTRSPRRMTDPIDDTTEPSSTFSVHSPSRQNWINKFFIKGSKERRKENDVSIPIPNQEESPGERSRIPAGAEDADDDDVSFHAIPPAEPADFNIESNQGDQLPLIRGPSQQGIIHRLLRRVCANPKPDHVGPTLSLSLNQSEDDEIEEGGKEGGGDNLGSLGKEHHLEVPPVPKSPQCSVGILLASISCIFFATSSLIVKVSALHPMELLCVRGLLQALLVVPIIVSSGSSFWGAPGSRGLLLARATLGSVSLIMAFNSIHLIPLADASTVIFTSPVFVSLFACICLGELCTWFDVSMISLTVIGVVLVSKPSFGMLEVGTVPGHGATGTNSWTNLVGIFCGVCAAMLTALAFIVLRQLKHVHYAVTVFWFSSVLAAFGGVLTIALDGFTLPNTWLTVIQCLGIGVCGFMGQILLTKALQLENAGPVAVARTLDIVLSFLYQIIFLHDAPDWMSYLGSALVVACVVLTALRRWYNETKGKREAHMCSTDSDRRRPTSLS